MDELSLSGRAEVLFRTFGTIGDDVRGDVERANQKDCMILVIGQARQWDSLRRLLPGDAVLRFVPFRHLSADLLREVGPDMVLCQLIGAGHDAVDVGEILLDAGFDGRFRVVTPPLPDAALVRSEIGRALGGIDFDLVIVGARLS